jgi:hypothetical protein
MDPRTDNCKEFKEEGGKITGVELAYQALPDTKYELVRAELIDEESAKGAVTARIFVLSADNVPVHAYCYLAWPWRKPLDPDMFDERLLPGNANYPFEHIITNTYAPPKKGPLAIYIGDRKGWPISDLIAGFGLPNNRHISFHLVFRERKPSA